MNAIYNGDLVTLRAKFGINPTRVAVGAAALATTLSVESTVGYAASDTVMINAGQPTEETRTIAAIAGTVITFTAALTYAHAKREPVMKLASPTTVTFKVQKTDRTNDSYTPSLVSVGVFTQDITVDQAGVWEWQARGTGAVQKILRGKFEVLERL